MWFAGDTNIQSVDSTLPTSPKFMVSSHAKWIHSITLTPKLSTRSCINCQVQSLIWIRYGWDKRDDSSWSRIPLRLWTCETRQVTSFQSTMVGWAWDTFSFSKGFTGKKKEVTVSEYVQSQGGKFHLILRLEKHLLWFYVPPSWAPGAQHHPHSSASTLPPPRLWACRKGSRGPTLWNGAGGPDDPWITLGLYFLFLKE